MPKIIKGGIFIENKNSSLEKLEELIKSQDKDVFIKLLIEVLKLNIKNIEFDQKIGLKDISEYEFELIKIKLILNTNEEIEMYLKMIKKCKVKESIFCYWCTIYEEELMKTKDNQETILNKVLISELNKKKYQQRIFLEIENNKTQILETGTEVNFLEIMNYIEKFKSKTNKYERLEKYFDNENNDVLLIGIKMKRDKILE